MRGVSVHKYVLPCLIVSILLTAIVFYCVRDKRAVPRGFYSGEFCTGNNCNRDIEMLDCSNFGFISPDAGLLQAGPEGGCSPKNYPPLREFPKETTIRWRYADTGEEHSETIDLRGIVPPGNEGVTEFIFTNEYKWRVRFIPARPEPE